MPQLEGIPQVYGIHPHEDSSDQKHPLGTIGYAADGRKYRYAQAAGTALTAGNLGVAPDISTNHEDLAVNTFSVGDFRITVTLGGTAITGNEYDEGFVSVIDETGQGIMYKIANIPTSSAGSEDIIITLAEPIRVAAAAATTVTLYRNKYRDVVESDTNQTDLVVGVPNVEIAIDFYGWLQVGGPCSILVDSNDTTAGQPITNGNAVAGAVETRNAATEQYLGMQPVGNNSDAGEYGIYELAID